MLEIKQEPESDSEPTIVLEDSSEESDDDHFIVERIIQKRKMGIKTEYYVKWRKFPESENTWDSAENLNCPGLIKQFENKLKRLQERAQQSKRCEKDIDMKEGFARGLDAERIIGACEIDNQLTYLIKWKDTADADYVPAKEANIHCPKLVIEFLEKRIVFKSNDKIN